MEKIVLGLGDNIDYEIFWNSAIIERLIEEYAINAAELSTEISVDSERDLICNLLGFLKENHGGECYVSRASIIENIATVFEKKVTLGGTSVRAAIAMARLGIPSQLHLVTINDDVRRLLPTQIPYLCSAETDSYYPHLIVQYSKGTRIKARDIELCTTRSSRIIYTNDLDNALMKIHPDLGNILSQASVFLISGFNSMQDEALLEARLEFVNAAMENLPDDALVFYEDSGFHKPALSARVRAAFLPRIDLYSLNEDELQAYLGRKVSLLDPLEMAEALRAIAQLIPAKTLVLHTQHYALAFGEKAQRYEKALQAANTMAGTRFVFGDDFRLEDYESLAKFPLQEEAKCFAEVLNKRLKSEICCIPCIEADETKATTIGLGDAFVGGFMSALYCERKGKI